jgi:hypothetical protein
MSTVAMLPMPWSYAYRPAATLAKDGSGLKATIHFLTTNANLPDFFDVVSGLPPVQIPLPGGGTTPKIVPLQHPRYSRMYAVKIYSEAFGTPTGSDLEDLHSHVRVAVDFQAPTFPTDFGGANDLPYMKKSVKHGGKYTTIPGRKMRFIGNDELIDQDYGIYTGECVYIYTFYQCTSLGDDVIRAMLGRINDTAFLGIPDGQLRFDSLDTDEETSTGGVKVYTRQLTFTYQDHHWNDFFRKDGTLDTPNDDDGNPPFEHAEFNDLLTL